VLLCGHISFDNLFLLPWVTLLTSAITTLRLPLFELHQGRRYPPGFHWEVRRSDLIRQPVRLSERFRQ